MPFTRIREHWYDDSNFQSPNSSLETFKDYEFLSLVQYEIDQIRLVDDGRW